MDRMIATIEFYFIRHGQTDHNASENEGDHPSDIPLNQLGREQAGKIEPLVASLPVKTVCVSPMKRAKETNAILTVRMETPYVEIKNLEECSAKIWWEMSKSGMYAGVPQTGEARSFMDRVRDGINEALTYQGPVLIIAHGGIHWALCCWMGIKKHKWAIDNCIPVHFIPQNDGTWVAREILP